MESVLVQSFVKFNRQLPFTSEARNDSFQSFINAGLKNNLDVYLSRFDMYDHSKKRIRSAWVCDGTWKKEKGKKIDLMYYRGKNIESKKIGKLVTNLQIPLLNHPDIEQACNDKIYTSMIFPEVSPRTFLIDTHYQLDQALQFIRTKKVVLKPRFGSYGRGVIIIDKEKLRNGITKDTLLQEFIESSNGVKKMGIKGRHDIRIMIIDGEIDHCYVRLPKKGSYLGNMQFGAKKLYFTKSKLPKSIKRALKIIENRFKKHKTRMYSADFLMDNNNNPWLIELNSKPDTIYYTGAEKVRDKYYFNLCKSIRKYMKRI